MFTNSQIVVHPLKRVLECVWSLSEERLTCVWIERTLQAEARECTREEEQNLNQRVA